MAMSEEHKAKIRAGQEAARKRKLEAKAAMETAVSESAAKTDSVVEKKQVKRRNTQFGPRMKLGVFGEIPGYKMVWVNDNDGELEGYLYNGWQYVGSDEVDTSHVMFRGTDKDVGNRISRETSVGPGVRIRTYLLKISNEIYDELQMEIEAMAKERERPIVNGTYGLGEYEYRGNTKITVN